MAINCKYLLLLFCIFGVTSHGLSQNFFEPVSRVSGQNNSKGGSSLLQIRSINTNLTYWNTALPSNVDTRVKFNLGAERTYPIRSDLGIVGGFGLNTTISAYKINVTNSASADFNFYGVELYGNVGYQLEALDWFIVQGLIKAGPSWIYSSTSGYNLGTTSVGAVQINDIDFFGAFNLNSIFLLNSNRTWGVRTGVDFGFSGGTSYSLGVVVWAR